MLVCAKPERKKKYLGFLHDFANPSSVRSSYIDISLPGVDPGFEILYREVHWMCMKYFIGGCTGCA